MMGNVAGMSFFIPLLIFIDCVFIVGVISLIALLLPCAALWCLVSDAIPFNYFIVILDPAPLNAIIPFFSVFMIALIAIALHAKTVAMMRAHLSALITFANLAHLNVFVIAGIAQTASAYLAKSPALNTDCESAFSWGHVIAYKKMSPRIRVALA